MAMAAATPPVRRSPRGEATAERILDAAEACFAERGYAGTALRDVAAHVGIRIPSLYNHFASKEALYAAVLERGIGPVLDLLAEVLEGGPGSDAQARLVERVMTTLAARPNLARLVQYEILSGGEHLTPLLGRWIALTFERAQDVVRANPGARRWEPEQIPLLVIGMYHMVVGYFTTAPLLAEWLDTDLLSPRALARQTRFLNDVTGALFAPVANPEE